MSAERWGRLRLHLMSEISLVTKVSERPYQQIVRGRVESGVTRTIGVSLHSGRHLEIRDQRDRRGRWIGWWGWVETDAITIPDADLPPTRAVSDVSAWVSAQIRAAGGLRLVALDEAVSS